MPRPRLFRRVCFKPNVTYFKPAGVRMAGLEETVLAVDEFEAVRLKDLLGLEQEEAAKKMNISQPTFHRLLQDARKKIADAIVNGKAIKIKGGNFKMVQTRGAGMGQGAGRGMGQGAGRGRGAGQAGGSGRGAGMGRGTGRGMGQGAGFGGPAMSCVCTKCGYQETKQRGMPCINKKCPKCGAQMVRGQ